MPVASQSPSRVEPELCVIARSNDSLGTRGRRTAFFLVAAVSLGLGAGFVAVGAWPVLPYSVAELTVLGLAFRYVERRAARWERLTIAGDRVTVERGEGGAVTRREWNRRWLRVETTGAGFGRPPRLWLCFGGERWEFGEALPRESRDALATELKRLTGAR